MAFIDDSLHIHDKEIEIGLQLEKVAEARVQLKSNHDSTFGTGKIRIKHLETALRMLINKIHESALLSCSDTTAGDVHNFIGDVRDMAERVLTRRKEGE